MDTDFMKALICITYKQAYIKELTGEINQKKTLKNAKGEKLKTEIKNNRKKLQEKYELLYKQAYIKELTAFKLIYGFNEFLV